MRAMTLKNYGAKDGYFLTDLQTPEPKQGEVRIKVHASAFGPADYKVSRGIVKFLHARNFPIVLGNDFSGVVDGTGPSEGRWKAGDNVFGFLPYGPSNKRGAFAEFMIARAAANPPGGPPLWPPPMHNIGRACNGSRILSPSTRSRRLRDSLR